jgi:preprotein translocase subunit YajC
MTAMMTWQGWIGLVFMILGVWTASWFLYVRPQRKAKLAAATA